MVCDPYGLCYDSFGMVKQSTGFRNAYTYTGREWDKETGLYYYRARYYDPMEGRFISKDPKGYEDSANLYEYALANPINLVDPDGTTVQTCCGMSGQLPLPIVMNGLECMSKCLKTTILISSGWRTSASNAAAGGAKKSYHMTGWAADVHEPPSKDKLRKAAEECQFFVLPKVYPNRIHVDVHTRIIPKCEPDECKCKEIRGGK